MMIKCATLGTTFLLGLALFPQTAKADESWTCSYWEVAHGSEHGSVSIRVRPESGDLTGSDAMRSIFGYTMNAEFTPWLSGMSSLTTVMTQDNGTGVSAFATVISGGFLNTTTIVISRASGTIALTSTSSDGKFQFYEGRCSGTPH
jgi:hypothetical protein